jgi:hypothetical protein
VICGERHIEARKIVLELRQFPGADDRNDWHGSIAEPRQRHLCHAVAGFIGDTLDGGDDARLSSLFGLANLSSCC